MAGQFRVPGHGQPSVSLGTGHADLAGRRDDVDDLSHASLRWPPAVNEVGLLLRTQAGTGGRDPMGRVEGLAGRCRPQMLHRDLDTWWKRYWT